MEDPAGRKRVAKPLALCLQAREQGVLTGDLNMAQVAALSLASAYDDVVEREKLKSRYDMVGDIVDLWLKMEHPQAFEELERARAARETEEKPDQALVADDMNEMLEQMLRMAGMS